MMMKVKFKQNCRLEVFGKVFAMVYGMSSSLILKISIYSLVPLPFFPVSIFFAQNNTFYGNDSSHGLLASFQA